jgi:hypothetical protein
MPSQTHCIRGHEYDVVGVYVKKNGTRDCLACRHQRSAERNARRDAERKARRKKRDYVVPDSVGLSWAAGFFEGEGTVTLTRSGGRRRPWLTRLLVSVANTDRSSIEFFADAWGGRVRTRKQPSPASKVPYEWSIGGQRAAFFVEDLLPYLRTDRVRAKFEVALESQAVRWSAIKSPATRERLADLLTEMRRLNHRGVPDSPPTIDHEDDQ